MAKKTDDSAPSAKKKAKPAKEPAAPVSGNESASDDGTGGATPAAPGVSLERIVVFSMESQRYGLPIETVQEIQQIVAFAGLPDASPAIVGVINLRGHVVPAVDLRKLLGVTPAEYGLQTPMIFCRTSQGLVALIVDEVEDVVDVPPDSVQPPSKVHELADRLLGVVTLDDGFVFVFDIDALLPADTVSAVEGGSPR